MSASTEADGELHHGFASYIWEVIPVEQPNANKNDQRTIPLARLLASLLLTILDAQTGSSKRQGYPVRR